jgi:hypothetical protein
MVKKIALLLAAILLAIPNFINADVNETLPYDGREKFNSSLVRLRSVSALEKYIDSIATARSIKIPSPQYLEIIEGAVSSRFYHGFSHWKMNENWIAALGQKATGIGLACKVSADDILKNENAACSQQALVTMAMLRRKGIEYRPVYFPHHYAIEAHVGDRWYYLDANMEPEMDLSARMHRNWRSDNEKLKQYYPHADTVQLSFRFGHSEKATLGPVNDKPAGRVRLFQHVTATLSKLAWIIPLSLIFVRRKKKEK